MGEYVRAGELDIWTEQVATASPPWTTAGRGARPSGFSMGSAIAQELALRHPELVRSRVLVSTYARPDALWRSQLNFWRWLPEAAPSERAFFEGFFTWVYTPRARSSSQGNSTSSCRRAG
jgi:alpha/beta hydrolase fold